MSLLKYVLSSVTAATGGSAVGSIFVVMAEDALSGVPLIFAVSLPFTIVGASVLSLLSVALRDSLSMRWSSYFGLVLAALLLGALMPLPIFGLTLEPAFFGGLFALFTVLVWIALYRTVLLERHSERLNDG